MGHREGIREYLKDVEVHGLVYDWGAGTKPIKNYLKPAEAEFVTIDKLGHVKADVVADIEEKYLELGEPGHFAFCLEVIEHVWKPKALLENINAHLLDDGILYLSQPFMYEVHKDDDRVRYTHHGLVQLLKEARFKVEEIHPTVGDLEHAEGYILKATVL